MSKQTKKARQQAARIKASLTANGINTHHLLYPKKNWDSGYRKKLRDHPYTRVDIPCDSLHKEIHKKIFEIPIAREEICEEVYKTLTDLLNRKVITLADDPIKKLLVLTDLFEERYSYTARKLKLQNGVIIEFYSR